MANSSRPLHKDTFFNENRSPHKEKSFDENRSPDKDTFSSPIKPLLQLKKSGQMSFSQLSESSSFQPAPLQPCQVSRQKFLIKQRLGVITSQVIQSSRKLFKEVYQKQLKKIIVDKKLVYFRAKYSVISIVVVKKFSVQILQIQELIEKMFNWFNQKCTSMNIQLNLANRKMSMYQIGQFRKLQWEIAQEIKQKITNYEIETQIKSSSKRQKITTEQIIKERLEHFGQVIQAREEKLKQISDKVLFQQSDSQQSILEVSQDKQEENDGRQANHRGKQQMDKQQTNNNKQIGHANSSYSNRIKAKIENPLKKPPNMKRPLKFKRQLSFMQKSIVIARQMRIRMMMFYICLITALVLGSMVYFGWFTESEDM